MNWKQKLLEIMARMVVMGLFFFNSVMASEENPSMRYIPEFGLIESNTPFFVLDESVKSIQDGSTVTIVQGMMDSQRTRITYRVENLPDFSAPVKQQISEICHSQPELQLPDGGRFQGHVTSGTSWQSGYSRQIDFPTIQDEPKTAKLVFTCLEQSIISSDLTEVEMDLVFVPADPDAISFPLITIPSLEAELSSQKFEENRCGSEIQLAVHQYVKTDQSIGLFGSLKSLSGNSQIELVEKDSVHLIDSSGKDIPLIENRSMSDRSDRKTDQRRYPWLYFTEGNIAGGRASLTIDDVWIRVNANQHLVFETGTDPQPGQKWNLNQPFNICGRKIILKSVEVNAEGDGFIFQIDKPDDIGNVVLMDLNHTLLGGGGGSDESSFRYRDGIPAGSIHLTLVNISILIPGKWTAVLDLPALSVSENNDTSVSTCLTLSSWNKALQDSNPMPENLDGILVLYNPIPPDYRHHVMTTNLDGSDYQILAQGNSASLSPDNRQICFSNDSGLQLMDLETGFVAPLDGTRKNDSDPIWSPDGSRIAFTRGPASGLIGGPGPYRIYYGNPDGTQLISVLEDGAANHVMTWFADGHRLLYTVAGPDGASVKSIDLVTKEIVHYFDTNYIHSRIALSPNEHQAAYEVMLPGEHYGIQISDLDGKHAQLVVDAAPLVVTKPFWSPDGEWLVVSVYDEHFSDVPVLALIKMDTCQIIPLTNLHGSVSSWNP
ncbi:MAG: hypothetical protein GYA26_06320 [Flexilinea flocculi]|nr:hypothetical protein [Flexilinea flocculi]